MRRAKRNLGHAHTVDKQPRNASDQRSSNQLRLGNQSGANVAFYPLSLHACSTYVTYVFFQPAVVEKRKRSSTCYVACRSRGWLEAPLSWRPCRSRSAPPRTPEPRRAETDCPSWQPTEDRECPEPGRSVLRAHTQIPSAESVVRGTEGVKRKREKEEGGVIL